MEQDALTQIRRIGKVDVHTPLLIPSFSSVCDRKIGEVHSNLIGQIPDCSLVSAYDLAYDYIHQKNIWASNLVYIDSGNYEYYSLKHCKDGRTWSSLQHYRLLDIIKPLSQVVIVNFDKAGGIQKQIKSANALFKKYPSYASCFLCKPFTKSSNYIDVQTLADNINKIESFDIIAFTEKELGGSLIERCKNVLAIRRALASNGLNKPIHIFGCLDPLAVIIFYLCGADIFDGTNWLKFTFFDNLTLYTNDFAVLGGDWAYSDITMRNSSYVYNLSKLTLLTQDMRKYAKEGKIESFNLTEKIQKQISNIVNTAQLEKRW